MPNSAPILNCIDENISEVEPSDTGDDDNEICDKQESDHRCGTPDSE
jgi:hypothetical protein